MNICSGISGIPLHRTEDELIAGICPTCEDALIGTKGWGTAAPNLGKDTGKGTPIVINHKKHTPPPSKNFRNYPKRKQPWGMERN